MSLKTTEIKRTTSEELIELISTSLGSEEIDSRQATHLIDYVLKLESKPENLVGKPAESPAMQTFLANSNEYADSNDCKVVELRGFLIMTKDNGVPTREVINGMSDIYRGLPRELRFRQFDRAGSALLIVNSEDISNGD